MNFSNWKRFILQKKKEKNVENKVKGKIGFLMLKLYRIFLYIEKGNLLTANPEQITRNIFFKYGIKECYNRTFFFSFFCSIFIWVMIPH